MTSWPGSAILNQPEAEREKDGSWATCSLCNCLQHIFYLSSNTYKPIVSRWALHGELSRISIDAISAGLICLACATVCNRWARSASNISLHPHPVDVDQFCKIQIAHTWPLIYQVGVLDSTYPFVRFDLMDRRALHREHIRVEV